MKLVKEHINEFKRGLDPKRAMGSGIFTDLKAKMNGVLATQNISGSLNYIEIAEWIDQVDENTGEVGWPCIYISVEVKNHLSAGKGLIEKVKQELKTIFKILGIKGKVETSYNIFEYYFYPDN